MYVCMYVLILVTIFILCMYVCMYVCICVSLRNGLIERVFAGWGHRGGRGHVHVLLTEEHEEKVR